MCSERYADERPLGLRKYQLPPTSSLASKQECGTSQSPSALTAVRPLTPAPITQTRGLSGIVESLDLDLAHRSARIGCRSERGTVVGGAFGRVDGGHLSDRVLGEGGDRQARVHARVGG